MTHALVVHQRGDREFRFAFSYNHGSEIISSARPRLGEGENEATAAQRSVQPGYQSLGRIQDHQA